MWRAGGSGRPYDETPWCRLCDLALPCVHSAKPKTVAKAYLLLLLDTRALDDTDEIGLDLKHFRRVSCKIFGESQPTLGGDILAFLILQGVGETYLEACAKIKETVENAPMAFDWIKPILDERTHLYPW